MALSRGLSARLSRDRSVRRSRLELGRRRHAGSGSTWSRYFSSSSGGAALSRCSSARLSRSRSVRRSRLELGRRRHAGSGSTWSRYFSSSSGGAALSRCSSARLSRSRSVRRSRLGRRPQAASTPRGVVLCLEASLATDRPHSQQTRKEPP